MKEKEPDMIDGDLLVQRFLDQELSGEERVSFLVRLGRDEGLRRRLIELEQLMLGVSRVPPPIVPDEFVARVMQQIPEPAVPAWRRFVDELWAPRALRWNLASAAAVGCLVLLAAGGVVSGRLSWQPASGQRAADVAPLTASSTPVLVRLVVVQPGARTVEAAGDFNEWNPARTPLEPISNGAWAVTIPLEPGRYEYMFVVDGQQWIADPFAVEQSADGFGSRNAVLEVRSPAEAPIREPL